MPNVADFDPSTPSIARVYDYLLGGKDNFSSDRGLAERILSSYPPLADVVRENRQFLSRAVTWVANQGIGQFIDLGCGMPTAPNTDESAREIVPGARVAYVDNDPVVLSHLEARLAKGRSGVTVVDGDVRDVAATVDAVAAGIDLSAPACVMMGSLLHFFPADAARALVASYVAALAAGSYVVLSVGRGDGEGSKRAFGTYSEGAARAYNHPVADFASFFGPLELMPPGVVDARQWRPGWEQAIALPSRDGQTIVGVARVR
jgi:O-methyltransferase involved in polyketide biosynthesis